MATISFSNASVNHWQQITLALKPSPGLVDWHYLLIGESCFLSEADLNGDTNSFLR